MAVVVIAYFFAVLGVNLTLDRMEKSPAQSSFALYDSQGRLLLNYRGDLQLCPVTPTPEPEAGQMPMADQQRNSPDRLF